MMPKISIYRNAFDTKGVGESEFDVFLKDIQQGRWQDEILTIRTITDKAQRDAMKKRMPMVTIAGTFSERADKNLLKHLFILTSMFMRALIVLAAMAYVLSFAFIQKSTARHLPEYANIYSGNIILFAIQQV
jgi:hypothetical protein